MTKYMLFFVFLIIFFIVHVESINTVTLLPNLCGTMSMRLGCQIIQAHMGVPLGMGMYMNPVPSCLYTIQAAAPNQRIRFSVGTGENEMNIIMHNMGCNGARLQVLNSDGMTPLVTLCNGTIARTEYLSSGDRIFLNLTSAGGMGSILNFTAHVTSFIMQANCGNLFPCRNGRCIDPAGRCDTTLINNCGDFSDNSPGPPGNCTQDTTTATTLQANVTSPAITSTADNDLWIIGAAFGGVVGIYFLYWLFWRPGYLVWRCSCWRHWCRSPMSEGKVADGAFNNIKTKPSGDQGPNTIASNGTSGFSSKANDLSPGIQGITREPHIFK